RAGYLPDELPAAGRGGREEAHGGDGRERRQRQLRRDVRQQDSCELPVSASNSLARHLAIFAVALSAMVAFDGLFHAVMAQNPFGGPRPAAQPQAGGIVGWLLAKQSEFYRDMSATIRAAKSDGSAVWTLLAISFAYGIFHAAGPGHGKAVIS